jgi:hypothetical protein
MVLVRSVGVSIAYLKVYLTKKPMPTMKKPVIGGSPTNIRSEFRLTTSVRCLLDPKHDAEGKVKVHQAQLL